MLGKCGHIFMVHSQLEHFVENLKPSTVDEQIFPNVALGFGDTVPAMREQTVKVCDNLFYMPLPLWHTPHLLKLDPTHQYNMAPFFQLTTVPVTN